MLLKMLMVMLMMLMSFILSYSKLNFGRFIVRSHPTSAEVLVFMIGCRISWPQPQPLLQPPPSSEVELNLNCTELELRPTYKEP